LIVVGRWLQGVNGTLKGRAESTLKVLLMMKLLSVTLIVGMTHKMLQ
jgi:hypothetical protein